jgi:hypothetical protein
MAHPRQITLEERLSNLEAELREANQRVCALAAWRRRTSLSVAALTCLVLVCAWVVPVPAARMTSPIPFTITGSGAERLVVDENSDGTGLMMTFYNRASRAVLTEGVSRDGSGLVIGQSPDEAERVVLGIDTQAKPAIGFVSGGQTRAKIGWGAQTNGMGFSVWNKDGLILDMGEKSGNGYLVLADAKLTTRVEAGTETNGDGAVKVYGPTGKCGVPVAGIPCMMVAR